MAVGTVFLLVMVAAVVIGALVVGYALIGDEHLRQLRLVKKQNSQYEELVDRLREIAYDHRELDSALASIITDEIRSFERTNRKELS